MKIIIIIITLLCIVIGVLQLLQKGILLNNAFLYATKEQRKTMNKKPYYVQSGTVFLLIACMLFVDIIELLTKAAWLAYLSAGIVAFILIYAIASTVVIVLKKNKETP